MYNQGCMGSSWVSTGGNTEVDAIYGRSTTVTPLSLSTLVIIKYE